MAGRPALWLVLLQAQRGWGNEKTSRTHPRDIVECTQSASSASRCPPALHDSWETQCRLHPTIHTHLLQVSTARILDVVQDQLPVVCQVVRIAVACREGCATWEEEVKSATARSSTRWSKSP